MITHYKELSFTKTVYAAEDFLWKLIVRMSRSRAFLSGKTARFVIPCSRHTSAPPLALCHRVAQQPQLPVLWFYTVRMTRIPPHIIDCLGVEVTEPPTTESATAAPGTAAPAPSALPVREPRPVMSDLRFASRIFRSAQPDQQAS